MVELSTFLFYPFFNELTTFTMFMRIHPELQECKAFGIYILIVILKMNCYPYMCHGISIFPFSDLSVPGASLRPPALDTLARDMVKVRGTGDVVCK